MRGATCIFIPQFLSSFLAMEKQSRILDSDSGEMQTSGKPCHSSGRYCHSTTAVTSSSEGYLMGLSSQIFMTIVNIVRLLSSVSVGLLPHFLVM